MRHRNSCWSVEQTMWYSAALVTGSTRPMDLWLMTSNSRRISCRDQDRTAVCDQRSFAGPKGAVPGLSTKQSSSILHAKNPCRLKTRATRVSEEVSKVEIA